MQNQDIPCARSGLDGRDASPSRSTSIRSRTCIPHFRPHSPDEFDMMLDDELPEEAWDIMHAIEEKEYDHKRGTEEPPTRQGSVLSINLPGSQQVSSTSQLKEPPLLRPREHIHSVPVIELGSANAEDDFSADYSGRGHPRGRKDKCRKPLAELGTGPDVGERRGPGRPKGTGYKQIAAQNARNAGEPEPLKRKPGRPRKHPAVAIATELGPTAGPGKSLGNYHLRSDESYSPTVPITFNQDPPPQNQTLSHLRRATDVGVYLCENNITTPPDGRSSLLSAAAGVKPGSDHNSIPPPRPSRVIVPNEDPQRAVELSNDHEGDDYFGLTGSGVGEEEEPDHDDEADPGQEPAEDSMRRQVRKPVAPWLMKEFKAKVQEAAERGPDGLPALYSRHGTFWFPQRSNFFLLKSTSVSPQTLFNPRFFLWDPEPLVFEGISCPKCKTKLWRHGHIPRPRRCVDLSETFWLIGYRYRCSTCVDAVSKKRTITFSSWDSRILAQLPPALAAEFPARLSHRSGIARSAFGVMRSCFQNGMGSKQFADTLRVQHLRGFDELHLQYLHSVHARREMSNWRGETFSAFRSFDDRTDDGFHGFVPSAQWLRDMYDHFMEEHREELEQHTSMLSAEICAIDHSHKITKHIGKINGVVIFIGLLTVTNEKGQIRICDLVATKAHSQFELALKRMRDSLDLYGHSQPTIFYTDNMADKQFLETSFPSLRQDIVPVEQYAHLEALEIPDDIQILIRQTLPSIEESCLTIVDSLSEDGTVTVGFDTEWNVDLSRLNQGSNRSQTAIIQIAHQKQIYLLQVGHLLSGGHLPAQLRSLLANPRIQKAGRLVDSDLRSLQAEISSKDAFVGGVELAALAKERHFVSSAKVGLADLCAAVLGKRLDKNVPSRISTAWESLSLSNEHIQYAALDAYASLCIYDRLMKVPAPGPLLGDPLPQTPILLYHSDNTRLIARGIISAHCRDPSGIYDGINLTKTRTVIEVQDVLVSGAVISTHHKKALVDFGTPPFSLVCLRSHIRTTEKSDSPSPVQTPLTQTTTLSLPSQDVSSSSSTALETDDDSVGIGAIVLDHEATNDFSGIDSSTDGVARDPRSAAEGEMLLGDVPIWDSQIRSRVLKDPFHVFNMIYISKAHGIRVAFAHALRDALFIPDQQDKQRLCVYGMSLDPPRTWDEMLRSSASWLWRRCKRIIPPPEQLHPLVEKVFHTYGPLQDAKTGLPLFNTAAWHAAKNILAMVRLGHISDPPGIPLYYPIGIDSKANGLPIYRCVRGTNMTEGGVHKHIRSRLPISGVSPRHVVTRLSDFVLTHNILVGTFNSTGQHYRGHFDIWLINSLQEMLALTAELVPDSNPISGWVNGNLYQQTAEVFGILPVPTDVRVESAMQEFETTLDSRQEHQFLASKHGTRKAVLPVHTLPEQQLFSTLVREHPAFTSSQSGPRWVEAVKTWNRYADLNNGIFYKLIEHLQAYYATWKANLNVRQSLTKSADVRKPTDDLIRNSQRSIRIPTASERPLATTTVTAGLRPVSPPPVSSGSSATLTPSIAAGSSTPSTQPPVNFLDQVRKLARKRALSINAPIPPAKRTRDKRTCAKCNQERCPGSSRVAYCQNACRDCNRKDCRGRNSKRPTRSCQTAWD